MQSISERNSFPVIVADQFFERAGVGTGHSSNVGTPRTRPPQKKLDAYCRDPTTIRREMGGPLSGVVRTWASRSSRSPPTLLTHSGHERASFGALHGPDLLYFPMLRAALPRPWASIAGEQQQGGRNDHHSDCSNIA